MNPSLKSFLWRWTINTLAVLVAVEILPGIECQRTLDLFIASLLLGVLNAFLRPILMLIALPLVISTLGLFLLVINALVLYLVAALLPGFHVASFGWAFLGALVISLISLAVNLLAGTGKSRVEVRWNRRRPGPPGRRPPDGPGPVIDV